MQEIFERVTIIVPCWNESISIVYLVEEIDKIISDNFKSSNFEIVVVDDGSTDDLISSVKKISKAQLRAKFRLKLVQLRSNYGKDSAILAGFEQSAVESDYFCIIDADGQHPPSMIPEMYRVIKAEAELDQVVGFRQGSQSHSVARFLGSVIFSKLTKRDESGSVESDYRVVKRRILQDVLNMKGTKFHLQSIIHDTGAMTKRILYTVNAGYHPKKQQRKSRWTLLRLIDYALIALLSGKESIFKFMVSVFTVNLFSAAILIGLTIVRTIQTGNRSGTSTILIVNSLYFAMLASLLFLVLIYSRLILAESKQKPSYLVNKVLDII